MSRVAISLVLGLTDRTAVFFGECRIHVFLKPFGSKYLLATLHPTSVGGIARLGQAILEQFHAIVAQLSVSEYRCHSMPFESNGQSRRSAFPVDSTGPLFGTDAIPPAVRKTHQKLQAGRWRGRIRSALNKRTKRQGVVRRCFGVHPVSHSTSLSTHVSAVGGDAS